MDELCWIIRNVRLLQKAGCLDKGNAPQAGRKGSESIKMVTDRLRHLVLLADRLGMFHRRSSPKLSLNGRNVAAVLPKPPSACQASKLFSIPQLRQVYLRKKNSLPFPRPGCRRRESSYVALQSSRPPTGQKQAGCLPSEPALFSPRPAESIRTGRAEERGQLVLQTTPRSTKAVRAKRKLLLSFASSGQSSAHASRGDIRCALNGGI